MEDLDYNQQPEPKPIDTEEIELQAEPVNLKPIADPDRREPMDDQVKPSKKSRCIPCLIVPVLVLMVLGLTAVPLAYTFKSM